MQPWQGTAGVQWQLFCNAADLQDSVKEYAMTAMLQCQSCWQSVKALQTGAKVLASHLLCRQAQ